MGRRVSGVSESDAALAHVGSGLSRSLLAMGAAIGVLMVGAALVAAPTDPGVTAASLICLVGAVAIVAFWRRQRSEPTRRPPVVQRVPAAGGRRNEWPRVDPREHTPIPAAWTGPDRRRSSRLGHGCPLIGYVTVAADASPGDSERSWAAIEERCEHFAWNLLEIVHDRENRRIRERPGLRYALERIVAREADGLIVSDLHRLSRSIVDLGALLAWFRDAHATLVALDLNIDTSTPEGDHVAETLIALSVYEHERISTRTRHGLARVRAEGSAKGRPAVSDRPELMARIAAMRASKMTLQAIADQLNAEGVPTLRGGAKWRPSSIQATLGYQRPGPRDRLPSLKRGRP